MQNPFGPDGVLHRSVVLNRDGDFPIGSTTATPRVGARSDQLLRNNHAKSPTTYVLTALEWGICEHGREFQ